MTSPQTHLNGKLMQNDSANLQSRSVPWAVHLLLQSGLTGISNSSDLYCCRTESGDLSVGAGTTDMIFSVPYIISFLSQGTTLDKGISIRCLSLFNPLQFRRLAICI